MGKQLTEIQKADALFDECDNYLKHLEKEIVKSLKGVLSEHELNNLSEYIKNKQTDKVDSFLSKRILGLDPLLLVAEDNTSKLYLSAKEDNKTIEWYKKNKINFDLLLQKRKIIVELKKSLNGDTPIKNFLVHLNKKVEVNKNETNKDILLKHRDSFAKRFLVAIGNLLTLGIPSKISKNSFAFWKSHGGVFVDRSRATLFNAKDTINKLKKSNSEEYKPKKR